MYHKFKTFQICALSGAVAFANVSIAQQASENEQEQNDFVLEEVVVIGNKEVKLVEASVAFTQIDQDQILKQAPRSIADALINVPSLQTNNALGNTNNDFRFRGIGAGGTQFLEFEEDGIPITRDGPDFLYQISSTATAGIDVVRGGNAPILRTAAIGAVVNFKYKEGSTEKHEADVYLQTSDFGQRRMEFWVGGPISDQLTYSLAGHYTTDDGIREVDFGANEGTNLYGNLKYTFADDSGHFKVSARKFDESAIVYLGTPLLGSASNPQQIPGGPDVTTGSLLSKEIVVSPMYVSATETETLNLEDGNQREMSYFGTEFKKSWLVGEADVELISRNRWTDDESGFSGYYSAGFFLGGDIQTGSSIVSNMLYDFNSGIGALNTDVAGYSYALPAGFDPVSYSLTNQAGQVLDEGSIDSTTQAINSTSQTLANANGLFMPLAAFNQYNPQSSFQQDLELNVEFDTGGISHYAAIGYYYLDYDRDQNNRQSFRLVDVRPQASRVDVNVQNAAGDSVTLTDSGYLTHHHWIGKEKLNWGIDAYYATYEIESDRLTVDVGVRQDDFSFEIGGYGSVPVYGTDLAVPAPGGSVSPAQLTIYRFDGGFNQWDAWDTSETSYTVGVNYVLNDALGVYGRVTQGYLPAPAGATATDTLELGARFENDQFFIAVNYFNMVQEGDVQDRGLVIDGEDVTARVQTDRVSQGVEVEAFLDVTDALRFTLSGTVQQPEFDSGASATLAPGSNATQAQLDNALSGLTNLDGNTIANQPETLVNLGIEYTLGLGDMGDLTLSANGRHVGKVYAFDDNSQQLNSYTKWNLGMNYEDADGRWYGRVNVHNVTDEDAIVRIEGNAANAFPGAGSLSDGFIGRSVQGRNIVAGVGYRF